MKTSKKAVLLGVCLAALVLGFAVAHLWAAKRGKPASPPVPLLWKVSDADNALYLLGSFHLLKPEDFPLSSDIDAAFADAETVVLELSPAEMKSPELPRAMAAAGIQRNGRRLKDDLSPNTIARLDRWIKANRATLARLGGDAETMQNYEPWYAGLMVSLIEMGKLGLDPNLGLDRYIGDRAGEAGKPTAGLERGAEQIALLDGMSAVEEIDFLEDALDSSEDGGSDTLKMHDGWRRGDADALWHDMGDEFRREYPALYRRINVERNDRWIPKLEARLRAAGSDDTLVVVGSLHLLGDDGLVEKLRAKGYKVERICSACANGSARMH
jgi:uncharacterized protein